VPKEGNVTYNQQCDVILKPKDLWFELLLVTHDEKIFFCQICEYLEKDPLAIGIKGQLKNQNQIQNLLNDHDKFKFWDGFLYHDGLLYVFDGPVWF
jgi:hypothetical protein